MNKVLIFGIIVLIVFAIMRLFNLEFFTGNIKYKPKVCSTCTIDKRRQK